MATERSPRTSSPTAMLDESRERVEFLALDLMLTSLDDYSAVGGGGGGGGGCGGGIEVNPESSGYGILDRALGFEEVTRLALESLDAEPHEPAASIGAERSPPGVRLGEQRHHLHHHHQRTTSLMSTAVSALAKLYSSGRISESSISGPQHQSLV